MTITLDQRELDTVFADRTIAPAAPFAAGAIAVVSLALAAVSVVMWALQDPGWNLDTWFFGVDIAVAVAYSIASWVILTRRSHPVGWLFALAAVGGGLAAFGLVYGWALESHPGLPAPIVLSSMLGWGWVPGTLSLVTVAPWLVRDERMPRHAVLGAWLGCVPIAAIFFVRVTDPWPWPDAEPFAPLPIRSAWWGEWGERSIPWTFGVLVVIGLAASADVIHRWRCGPEAQRRGLGWLAVGSTVMAVSFFPLVLPASWMGDNVAVTVFTPAAHIVAQAFLPAAALVAILRQQMWSINLAVSRTVVWSLLTGSLVVLYLVVVGTAGHFVASEGAAAALGGAAVALLIGPARSWLQRRVDHLVRGDADTARAVRRLGRQLGDNAGGDELLLSMVDGLVGSLRLASAAVDVVGPTGLRLQRVVAGRPEGEERQVPLVVGATTIGWLVVTAPQGLRLDARSNTVVESVAPVIASGVALADLTEQVSQSRERLRDARLQERRVLRRELHDGLGPALAGIGLGLRAYENLRTSDPARAEELLATLSTEVDQRAADVRTLSRALLPPVLEELGLVAAVRELVARYDSGSTRVTLQTTVARDLPSNVAAAAYAIVSEALVNVHRHAGATEATVRLSDGANLLVEITDDGSGVDPMRRPGVGLRSMAERAADLGGTCTVRHADGGGTIVTVRIPLGPSR